MATNLKFKDDTYSLEVIININNLITFITHNKDDVNDYTVLQLENDDVKKLIKELKILLKLNT